MSTTEARAHYGAILQALADLVSLPQTDQQREDDVVPRDPVLQRVLSIRGAADGLIGAALAAAAPSPVADWLPIEMAPKDGTEVILRRGDRVAAAMWCEWPGHEEREAGASWSISYDGDGWDDDKAPTHFQYLPVAPTAPQPERYVSALDPVMQAIGKTWSAHGRDDGMRVPEASDLTGGSTDATAQPEAPAEPSELVIDGYRGEKSIRWYVAELHKVRFVNHWLADAYCNALQEVYERDLRGAGKDEQEARRLAGNKIADLANSSKECSEKRFKESGDDDRIAALKAPATASANKINDLASAMPSEPAASNAPPGCLTPEGIAQACENSFNWLMHGHKTGPCIAAPQFAEAARLLRATPAPVAPAEPSVDDVGALQYRGNTVSYMYDRAKAYGDEIMRCWHVLKDAGKHPGRTDDKLHEVLRSALATPAPVAQQTAELTDAQIDVIARDFGLWNIRLAIRSIVRTAIKSQGGSQ